MSKDLREVPIQLAILEHTGKQDGDDAGYRNVAVCEDDVAGRGDPLVELDPAIARYAVYTYGAQHGITPAYGGGLGAPATMLVRKPINPALLYADALLHSYDRRILVVDAFRSVETQRRLFDYLFRSLATKSIEELSTLEFLKTGIEADNIGAYVALVKDDIYIRAFNSIVDDNPGLNEQVAMAAKELDITLELAIEYYLTFHRNLGYKTRGVNFDTTSNTAHGGGGAVDAILADMNGKPLNLGVPFDYVGPESVMDFFERDGEYRLALSNSQVLRDHWDRAFDEETTIREGVDEIRRNRRLLYHAMVKAGATIYNAECWHFNLGNGNGGLQFDRLPNAGSACHSLLKNVRDPKTGEWTAVWGNAWAQKRASEMTGVWV